MISAPLSLITSCGAIVLPTDFDILRPSRSIRKPCVSTCRNGGRPRVAERHQQRALEPAAVLIAAFEIHVGRPRRGRSPARQHGLVARPRVEPHVENVPLALERRAAARRARQARRAGTPRSAARTRRRRRAVSNTAAALLDDAAGVEDGFAARRAVHAPGSARPRRAGARCTSRAGSPPC